MSNSLTPESRGRLINLKTNLKSLRFGGDRPASGTSNQPYIVEPIPEGTGDLREGMPQLSGPDFLLRGGMTAPFRALKDVSRLVKMFTDLDSPRGIFFTLKENLLSRASVKTQASFGVGYFAGVMNQGAYLPIGTILDAGLGWAGIHLNKNGINPIGALGGPAGMIRGIDNPLKSDSANQVGVGGGALNLYSAVVKNDQDEAINRLTNLQYFIEEGAKGKSRKENKNFQKEQDLNLLQRIGKNNGARFTYNPRANRENQKSPVLYSYGGGPGSILGVGKTNIFREQPTYNAIRDYQNLSFISQRYSGVQPNGTSTLLHGDSFRSFSDQELGVNQFLYPKSFINYIIEHGNPEEKPIAEDLDKFVSKIIHKAPNYTTQNKALRVGLGDPGQAITYAVTGSTDKVRNVFNYGIPAFEMEALDKITALKLYEGEKPNSTLPIDDLVKFRIAVINNGPSEGKKATYIHFRAYINGFTDSYAAAWNDTQYVGRGNVFKNYSGYTRDISMGFTVMATSKAELIPMFSKLNYLASSLAPDYNNAGFMMGNMVRMTVGGYLYEVPGVLTSLTYTIPDDTTWEIAIDADGNSDSSVKELPHRIEVSLAFTPVEDFLPSRQKLLYNDDGELLADPVGDERFISMNNGRNNNYSGEFGLEKYLQPIKSNSDE